MKDSLRTPPQYTAQLCSRVVNGEGSELMLVAGLLREDSTHTQARIVDYHTGPCCMS